ncbi:MAG TPA: OB-fold domain-containing protein [Acidimicrobiales bacterium]
MTDVQPIVPVPDELTAFFWEGARQHKLLIQRCDVCGYYLHWPRPCCKRCNSFELTPVEVSGRGTLYSYTVAVHPFHPWLASRLPYVLAVVELEEQHNLKLVTNIVDCAEEDLRCGLAVEVTYETIAEGSVLPMFRPRAADGPVPGGVADERAEEVR